MKKLLLLPFLLAGCTHTDISKFTKELGNDHATVILNLVTPWGTERIVRINPNTNQNVTVTPEGNVIATGASQQFSIPPGFSIQPNPKQ